MDFEDFMAGKLKKLSFAFYWNFYQPFCRDDLSNLPSNVSQYIPIAPLMCANFIFDLNGKRGPNKVGKDIGFITAFYPTDGNVVMPIPFHKDSATGQTYANALKVCRNVGTDVRLPNREELASMAINADLLKIASENVCATTNNWKMDMPTLVWTNMGYGNSLKVICIKR